MSKYAVFTMDVEAFSDTECIRASGNRTEEELLDGFDRYISLLDRYGIKSTLFTVGRLAPQMTDRLRRCIRKGHRLALHSYDHIAPMTQSPEQFREQTLQARTQMSQLFNTQVEGFRAPCFSIDRQRLDIPKELGFRYDSSHLGFTKARHTVELDLDSFRQVRSNVYQQDGFYEFGISRQKLFGCSFPISGGGYVRLPHWGTIKHLIRRHIKKNDYYVFYLHPFELTCQRIPIIRKLKLYDQIYLHAGIRSYSQKIEQIIQMLKAHGYRFVTFEELTQIMSREQTQ